MTMKSQVKKEKQTSAHESLTFDPSQPTNLKILAQAISDLTINVDQQFKEFNKRLITIEEQLLEKG